MQKAKIIDGNRIATEIYSEIQNKVAGLSKKPKLRIILASDDESSRVYVNLKAKKAKEIGIESEIIKFEKHVEAKEVFSAIEKFNNDENITGILVQLPLFDHLEEHTAKVLDLVNPKKDVDGLGPMQQGMCFYKMKGSMLSATADAVLECIGYCYDKRLNWNSIINLKDSELLKGVNILIINDSNLIGRPLALALNALRATVTLANEFSSSLPKQLISADIVISATGQTEIIDYDMIKQGSILIDVTSAKKGEKIKGDFIWSMNIINKSKYITPVPGGVGPLTVACLLRNLVKA